MKYLSLSLAALLWSAAAPAQDGQEIIVRGSDETTAEVFPVGPGVAELEMGPLYGVFLGDAPASVRIRHRAPDRSGKGEASMGNVRAETLGPVSGLCWVPIRMALAEDACGEINGSRVRVTLAVGPLRNALFGLYPVITERASGRQLAFAAHPENTQILMRCERGTDMASVFYVDGAGVISIATPVQMREYADSYCGRSV